METKYSRKLAKLRRKIDRIDARIETLERTRTTHVQKVVKTVYDDLKAQARRTK